MTVSARAALGAAGLAAAVGCGIAIGRDLQTVTPPTVINDDLCELQGYFDTIEAQIAGGPQIARTTDVGREAEERASGGRTTFVFATDFQLANLRRVLAQNWKGLPADLLAARRVEIEVRWARKAGVKRAVTTDEATVSYGSQTRYLPYQVCLSDLLFGAPLYRTRREMLGLPLSPVSISAPDAGPPPH